MVLRLAPESPEDVNGHRLLLRAILSCGLVERACRQSRDNDDKSLIEQFGAEDSGMRIGLVIKLEDVAKSGSQAWKEAMRAGGDSSMIEIRSSGFQYWFDEERAREHARDYRPVALMKAMCAGGDNSKRILILI